MHHELQTKQPRLFQVIRHEDATGVSGTGIVARGLEFPNGFCLMQWVVPPAQSVAVYERIEDLLRIHGHNGRTVVEYLNEDQHTGVDIASVGKALEATVVAMHTLTKMALAS